MRRQNKKPKQPPFILLDHNVQKDVALEVASLARFRQVGETEKDPRFQRDSKDHEIFMGPCRFLFVTHDRGFLDHSRLPGSHGGVLVLLCSANRVADTLRFFLEWWGPKRNLLKRRVFALYEVNQGWEAHRDGTYGPIYRGSS